MSTDISGHRCRTGCATTRSPNNLGRLRGAYVIVCVTSPQVSKVVPPLLAASWINARSSGAAFGAWEARPLVPTKES